MKLGVNTLLWTAGFGPEHFHLLPWIKRQGFDGVEIARFDFDKWPAAQVRRAVEDAGLECTLCSAFTGVLSFTTGDAGVRAQTKSFLLQAIEMAAEVGSPVLVGPYCSPIGYLPGRRPTEDEWKRAVDGISSVKEALDSYGVTIALEALNRFETNFMNTAADAARFCNEVGNPSVGVLFDTFHANIEEKNITDALRSIGGHLRHVHTCENDRGIPGSGHVDWEALFFELRRMLYDDWLVIESFGSAIPEIAAAACVWRDLAPNPEAIAVEGVRFLQGFTKGGALARTV